MKSECPNDVIFADAPLAPGRAGPVAGCRGSEPSHLAIGAPAPEFSLPGIDGKSHALRDYADSRALAIVFTGNSCPVSQQYEARIRKLHEDYRDKGVSVVAINPNAPAAIQLADLGYSDVGETLDDMKARAADRQLLPLSLGRPGSGGLKEVRRRLGATRLRLRSGAHAAGMRA